MADETDLRAILQHERATEGKFVGVIEIRATHELCWVVVIPRECAEEFVGAGSRTRGRDDTRQRVGTLEDAVDNAREGMSLLLLEDDLQSVVSGTTDWNEESTLTEERVGTGECRTVRCIGCCALAPAMRIDGVTFGKVKLDKVVNILEQFA